MKTFHRKVLRKLLPFFAQHLLVNGELCDLLVSTCELDEGEAQIINEEKNDQSKAKPMVLALISKKNDDVYNNFKKCLEKTKNEHVLLAIETEEKTILQGKIVEDETNTVFTKHMRSAATTSFTSLRHIQDILFSTRNEHNLVEDVLDEEWLTNVILTIFPDAQVGVYSKGVQREKRRKRREKNQVKTEAGFFGLELIDDSEQSYVRERQESECSQSSDTELNEEQKTTEESRGKDKSKLSLSIEGLYNWVKRTLQDHDGDSSAAEGFKKDRIDGSVFDTLSSHELEGYIPIFGQRRKIEIMWKNFTSHLDSVSNEISLPMCGDKLVTTQSLRPFDSINAGKHKYRQGAKVSVVDARRGNPLRPVHLFRCLMNQQICSSKEAEKVALEVVKFGSACMNDKTNGTIHFGIGNDYIVNGCKASMKLIERKITQTIRHLFYDGQVSIALNCIRPPQFIEVLQKDNNASDAVYVVEVDVVSSAHFVEDFAFFLKQTAGEHKTKSVLYRYLDDVQTLQPDEIENFMYEEKQKLFINRRALEERQYASTDENRFQRLKNFLCCGSDSFEPSIYPVLLLNDMQGCRKDNAEFIRHVEWRAIFDFSPSNEKESTLAFLEMNYGKVFNKNFIEDFDQRQVSEAEVKHTIETLKSSSLPNWIYCNGPWKDIAHTADPRSWKLQRSHSFRKAVEFYYDNFPSGRGRVLIPLFKHGDGLLVEAAEEVFIKFNNNCMILAEVGTMSNDLVDALQKRNVLISTTGGDDSCLTGLPWAQVTEAFNKLSPTAMQFHGLELHRSTGVPVKVPITFRPELCDLDILFMNEGYEISEMNKTKKEELKTRCGEDFYRGNAVSWHNFYFDDQVLSRDINQTLVEKLVEVTKRTGNFNRPVRQVIVYHQPGAGGSTSAKHALWQLKDKFRCCVVRNFTKQTTEQISRLRMYGEDDEQRIDPIVVLVETDDDETVSKLNDELENECQRHSCEVFCVMLVCRRVSELPVKRLEASVFLKQQLSHRELEWFNHKYEDLNKKHAQNRGCDPQTLLALNVMKANFNRDAIGKYVVQYVNDPQLSKEHIRLLKYLSFLNNFDIRFQPVPKDIFDPIMTSFDWILHIPQSMRILVNPVSVNGVSGKIPCLRIANYLLSLPVLDACIEIEKQFGHTLKTVGEVAKEILNSKIVSPFIRGEIRNKFERILSDIIKKRSFSHNAGKKTFSLLIMILLEANDYDTAIDIIERVYEVTDDQMVAQQLARFHAEIGNWDHAYQVIEKAMTAIHDNAYLNHTCGQIYKMQFESVCKEKGNIFTDDECLQALQIAQSARFYFKETQRISKFENSTPRNPAGFDGEIRISIDILKSFFINDIVAMCIKKDHVIPATRQSLQDCPCKFITSIKENTLQAIESLQAESNLMCMNRINLHGDYYLSLMEGNKIKRYRRDFNKYSKKSLRGDIKDEALVNSFIEATQATDEQLQQVIVKHEKTTNKMAKQDLRSFIGTVIELILRRKEIKVDTCNILKLCRQFYEARTDCNNSTVCKLEAHFDLLVLHWPLECKAKFREELCPHSVVKNALESWKQLTDERPNKQDKLFCFLSNDIRFPCLIKAENATKSNLHVLNGMICSNGQEVEIRLHTFRTDNIPPIRISTLYPIRMASLYNKLADIVIGFGLNGPKAELLESVIGTPLSMSPRDVKHKTTKVQSKPHASRALQMHQRTAETGARPKSNASLHQFKGQSVHRENTPHTGQQIQHQVLSPPQGFQGLIPRGVLPLQPRGLTFNTDMFPPLPHSNELYYFFKNQKPPNQ